MATPVIMPKFEMAQETGQITRWLVAEGAVVEQGQPIAETETDKATMEIEAPASGVLRGVCGTRAWRLSSESRLFVSKCRTCR